MSGVGTDKETGARAAARQVPGIDRVALGFLVAMRENKGLRTAIRRHSALDGLALLPQVHTLHDRLAAALPEEALTVASASRVASLLAEVDKPIGGDLGAWVARCWRADRASRPNPDWQRGCHARLGALLRTPNPDLFLRLLKALVPRGSGRLPLGPASEAVVRWESRARRRVAAESIALGYARATAR